jgi:hypothetical protein
MMGCREAEARQPCRPPIERRMTEAGTTLTKSALSGILWRYEWRYHPTVYRDPGLPAGMEFSVVGSFGADCIGGRLGGGPLHAASGFAIQPDDSLEQLDASAETFDLSDQCNERVRGHQVQRVAGCTKTHA